MTPRRRRRRAASSTHPRPTNSRLAGSGTGGVTLKVPVASAVASATLAVVSPSPGAQLEKDRAKPRGTPKSAGSKTSDEPVKKSGGSEAFSVGLEPPALHCYLGVGKVHRQQIHQRSRT
jgi:hypothetical protein